jgi:hypothetical protein
MMPEPGDARPVAPPIPVSATGPGAFAERQMPWFPGPASMGWARSDQGDTVWFILSLDSGSSRTVTFWRPDALEAALRKLLDFMGVLPDGLVLATADDLRDLPSLGGPGASTR